MTSTASTGSALPHSNSTTGVLNLDHYKYLRSLLPPIPHFIESLSFTDLNNWECTIYVALLSESDCMKWLTDFQETSKTDWRVDQNLLTNGNNNSSSKKVIWGMSYRCIPPSATMINGMRKESSSSSPCQAKLEMKILSQSDSDNTKLTKSSSSNNKQSYPCMVNINFIHNHTINSGGNGSINHVNNSISNNTVATVQVGGGGKR